MKKADIYIYVYIERAIRKSFFFVSLLTHINDNVLLKFITSKIRKFTYFNLLKGCFLSLHHVCTSYFTYYTKGLGTINLGLLIAV